MIDCWKYPRAGLLTLIVLMLANCLNSDPHHKRPGLGGVSELLSGPGAFVGGFSTYPKHFYLTSISAQGSECVYQVQHQPSSAFDEAKEVNNASGSEFRALYFSSSQKPDESDLANWPQVKLEAIDQYRGQWRQPSDGSRYLIVAYTDIQGQKISQLSYALHLPPCTALIQAQKSDAQNHFDMEGFVSLQKSLRCPASRNYVVRTDINRHHATSDYVEQDDDFLGAMYQCDPTYTICHVRRRAWDYQNPAVNYYLTERTETFRPSIEPIIDEFNEVARQLDIMDPDGLFVSLAPQPESLAVDCDKDFIDMVPADGQVWKGAGGISRFLVAESGELLTSAIFIDHSYADVDRATITIPGLQGLIAHEMGHTIGWDHNFAAEKNGYDSFMDYLSPAKQRQVGYTISSYDKAVFLYQYGRELQAPQHYYGQLANGQRVPWKLLRKQGPGQLEK